MKRNNVLVLSAGRRVSLVKSFQAAAKEIGLNSHVYTADTNVAMAAACQISDGAFKLPHCLAEWYITDLLALCEKQGIGLVVPTIDTELKVLAQCKNQFSKKGVLLAVSDFELVVQCRDKRLTNKLFKNIGFDVPITYELNEIKFPCFSKPVSGSLSQDIKVLSTQEELDSWPVQKDQMMFMEVIDRGLYDEYTIDIYYDLSGALICVVPRKRIEVRGGEVSKAITDKAVIPLIKPIMEQLKGAFGCMTLQVFKHREKDKLYGIEINPRFGGGVPLSILSGAEYPKWLMEEAFLDLGGKTYYDGWQDKLMMLRYDAEVLIECDRG